MSNNCRCMRYMRYKHIEVKLDFIPVEERLPAEDHYVIGRMVHRATGKAGPIYKISHNGGIWYGSSGNLLVADSHYISHWSENPVTEGS